MVREQDLEPLDQVVHHTLDESRLVRELDSVRQRNQIIDARIEQLNQALLAGRREEALLEDLLALRRGERSPGAAGTLGPARTSGSARLSTDGRLATSQKQVSHPVIDGSIQVLRQLGQPVHIGQLMLALEERNIEIPGSGEQANLISYLRRDSRIVRPARGVYGLREWGLEDVESASKKKTTKGKRSRRRTSRTKKS